MGDKSNQGLSHLSMRFSCFASLVLVVLWRTSPRGPPIELGSHEMGAQLLLLILLLCPLPNPNPISSSPDPGAEDVMEKSEGMEMESCVRCMSRSGWSMNWRSSLGLKGFRSKSEYTSPNSWFLESLGLILGSVVVCSTTLLQMEKDLSVETIRLNFLNFEFKISQT